MYIIHIYESDIVSGESPKKRGGITWYSPLQSSTGVLNTAQ